MRVQSYRRRTLLAAFTLYFGVLTDAVFAEDCNIASFNTVQRSECESRNDAEANERLNISFNRLLTAAAALKHSEFKVDFEPNIEKTRKLWDDWANAQCSLEADATMGSAGAFWFQVCHQRLVEDRIKSLNRMAEDFETLSK